MLSHLKYLIELACEDIWPYAFACWKFFLNLFILIGEQLGFPNSSVGKESACNAEDPSLIPELGRSAGE